eukprot:gene9428-biopygen13178
MRPDDDHDDDSRQPLQLHGALRFCPGEPVHWLTRRSRDGCAQAQKRGPTQQRLCRGSRRKTNAHKEDPVGPISSAVPTARSNAVGPTHRSSTVLPAHGSDTVPATDRGNTVVPADTNHGGHVWLKFQVRKEEGGRHRRRRGRPSPAAVNRCV